MKIYPKLNPVIEAQGLTKRFGQLTAVVDLNLTIQQGQLFALVGPDGAGKTTTLRMLCCIMDPDFGQLKILGFNSKIEKIKKFIGYVPQRFSLYDDLTVIENLAFYADIHQLTKINKKNRISELINFCGLKHFKDYLAKHLSGGMRQKLSLICSLVHTPKILILDEPTCGIDPISRREFWQLLQKLLNTGLLTIILSTTYLNEAEHANYIGLINKGRLLIVNSPKDLRLGFKGQLIEIRAHESFYIFKQLKKHPLCQQISLISDRIIVSVNNYKYAKSIFLNYLQALGFTNLNLKIIEPTLNDCFIQIIELSKTTIEKYKND